MARAGRVSTPGSPRKATSSVIDRETESPAGLRAIPPLASFGEPAHPGVRSWVRLCAGALRCTRSRCCGACPPFLRTGRSYRRLHRFKVALVRYSQPLLHDWRQSRLRCPRRAYLYRYAAGAEKLRARRRHARHASRRALDRRSSCGTSLDRRYPLAARLPRDEPGTLRASARISPRARTLGGFILENESCRSSSDGRAPGVTPRGPVQGDASSARSRMDPICARSSAAGPGLPVTGYPLRCPSCCRGAAPCRLD